MRSYAKRQLTIHVLCDLLGTHTYTRLASGGIKLASRIMQSYNYQWRKLLAGAIKHEQFDDDDDDVDDCPASYPDDPASRSAFRRESPMTGRGQC